jgi:predicted  nucleic acid-binding Zn-ribbon protein
MSGKVSESVECGNCGYIFQDDELERNSREQKPCPNCGSLRRHIRLSVRETLGLSEYVGIKAKKQNSKHKKNRADYELEEGKKKGKDGKLVYKKRIVNREHPDLPNSYVEVVKDKDGKIIVNKSEKLSEHEEYKRVVQNPP